MEINLHLASGETVTILSKDHATIARDLHIKESITHADIEKKLKTKSGAAFSYMASYDTKKKKIYDGKKPPKKKPKK